mgnify:CR=1 FL=1
MQSNSGNMTIGDKVILSAVIGGTAEALGGGKFANGAVTGAYVYLLNHAAHKWHPTRESAANAAKTRTETTGNEASCLVYKDECGDEYYWENPAHPSDTELQSKWTSPKGINLTLVEEFHFSKEFTSDGHRILGSFQDWVNAQDDRIKITHTSLNFGKWVFTPGRFYDGGTFTPYHPNNIWIWNSYNILDIMKSHK